MAGGADAGKFDPAMIPNLTGKVAIVTGANQPTGIGFHTAKNLALKGAKTYVHARSLPKSRDAIETMQRESPALKTGGLLHPLVMDVGNLNQVRSVGREFAQTEGRLDILVNNAALGPMPLELNEHGISVLFTTSHLGPFIFTNQLLPLLAKTAQSSHGVRIVNLSSKQYADVPRPIKMDSLDAFNQKLDGRGGQYGLSKLATILFTKELQKRFDAEDISAIAMSCHPGAVRTGTAIRFLESINKPELVAMMMEPADGALTTLFAATDAMVWKEKQKYGGAYLVPFGLVGELNENGYDADLAKQLWAASEQVVKDALA